MLKAAYVDEFWALAGELQLRLEAHAAKQPQPALRPDARPAVPVDPSSLGLGSDPVPLRELVGARLALRSEGQASDGPVAPTAGCSYAEVEDALLESPPGSLAPVDMKALAAQRRRLAARQPRLARLEQVASGLVSSEELDHAGALASLSGQSARFLVKRPRVTLGRSVPGFLGGVDLEITHEGPGKKTSRMQAVFVLDPNGIFHLRNLGRKPLFVNGMAVPSGRSVPVPTLSLLEVGGHSLLFTINQAAVARFAARNTQQ